MKKIYIITFTLVLSYAAFGQQTTPLFDGGPGVSEKLNPYIYSQLRKPEPDTIVGRFTIVIQYAIDVDGSVVDTKIVQGAHPILDAEVLRVFNSIPKELWTPALNNRGKPVKSQIISPVFYDRQPD